MYYSTSSGRIELNITRNDAHTGYHQGQCDDDVAGLLNKPSIRRQMDKLDPKLIREELAEWGAWDDEDLKDHEQNKARMLWLACAGIVEELAEVA